MKVRSLLLKVFSFLVGIFSTMSLCSAASPGKYDVKLSFRNVKLEKVLDEFTGQPGITFSYETSLGELVFPLVPVKPITHISFAGSL